MSDASSHDMDSKPWVPPWDGAAYSANTGHHRAYDADFLASTPIARTDHLLDLGCGSGDLTAGLAALVPDGHVVGLDAQPSMLAEARRRALPNQFFVEAPLQRLGEALPSPDHDGAYDVVLSRAVLQWVPLADWPQILADAARLVRPDGWVRIECGGAGNIGRVLEVVDPISVSLGGPTCPWTFTDAGTALDLLEAAGLDPVTPPAFVRTVAQRRPFDEASLLGWFRSQAHQAYEASLPPETHQEFRRAVEARLDDLRRHDGALDQTFVRLDLLARRPG